MPFAFDLLVSQTFTKYFIFMFLKYIAKRKLPPRSIDKKEQF